MDDLSAYQARRLELGDMLRTLLHLVRNHDDQQRERAVRALLTRLASGRFQLAVAGQFSRGKSTLMNALLGDAYLPMGSLPMTSVHVPAQHAESFAHVIPQPPQLAASAPDTSVHSP